MAQHNRECSKGVQDLDAVYKNRVRKMRLNPDEKVPEPIVESENEKLIGGWQVKWRDWQHIPNMDAMIGLWCAYPPMLQGWSLYSACPGACGPFLPGFVLDLSTKDGQRIPSMLSSEADLAAFKEDTLERLKELIWEVGPPPYDPYAKQREEEARYATS